AARAVVAAGGEVLSRDGMPMPAWVSLECEHPRHVHVTMATTPIATLATAQRGSCARRVVTGLSTPVAGVSGVGEVRGTLSEAPGVVPTPDASRVAEAPPGLA